VGVCPPHLSAGGTDLDTLIQNERPRARHNSPCSDSAEMPSDAADTPFPFSQVGWARHGRTSPPVSPSFSFQSVWQVPQGYSQPWAQYRYTGHGT
jgi:hypothetical protein